MKQSLQRASFVTALFMVLAIPVDAFAGEVFRVKGENVHASFRSVSGCIVTSVSVFASSHRMQNPPGPPTGGPWALVSVYQADRCDNYRILFSGSGQKNLEHGELKIDSSLAAASLSTVIQGRDSFSSAPFIFSVDVAWEASGFMTRANVHHIYDWPGYRSSYRSIGTYRAAQASGLVSFGAGNPELMEGDGSIESTRSGSVSVDY